MTDQEKYEAVLRRLQDAAQDDDQESAHVEADDALCDALLIALGDAAKPILDAYGAIGKWFA